MTKISLKYSTPRKRSRWLSVVTAALALVLAVPHGAEAKRQALADDVLDSIHAKGLTFNITVEPVVVLPNVPSAPLAPSSPEAPSAPIVPASPQTTGNPVSPGTPSLPQAPASVGTPTTPTAPVAPYAPTAPTVPSVPVAPTTPSSPVAPETTVSPTLPVPPVDVTAPEVVVNAVGGVVEPLGPSGVTTPTTPNLPVQPTLPTTPTAPQTPNVPEVPKAPTTPTAPNLTTLLAPESLSQKVNSVTITDSFSGNNGLVTIVATDSVVPVLLNIYINVNSTAGNSTNVNVLDLKTIQADL